MQDYSSSPKPGNESPRDDKCWPDDPDGTRRNNAWQVDPTGGWAEGSNFDRAVLRQLLNKFDENSEKVAITWKIGKVALKGKNLQWYAPMLGVALIVIATWWT